MRDLIDSVSTAPSAAAACARSKSQECAPGAPPPAGSRARTRIIGMPELSSFVAGAAAATAAGCCLLNLPPAGAAAGHAGDHELGKMVKKEAWPAEELFGPDAPSSPLRRTKSINIQGEAFTDSEIFQLFDRFETAVRHRYPTRVILVRHGAIVCCCISATCACACCCSAWKRCVDISFSASTRSCATLGESEGNIDLEVYRHKSDAALRLTAKGRDQAIEAGRQLKEDIGDSKVHFIVSPYTRTRETLHGILQAFDPSQYDSVVEDPRVREQEFGMYQDPDKMPEIMRTRRSIGAFYYRFPDGESGADVYDRVDNFVEHLHRTFRRPAHRGGSRRANVVRIQFAIIFTVQLLTSLLGAKFWSILQVSRTDRHGCEINLVFPQTFTSISPHCTAFLG